RRIAGSHPPMFQSPTPPKRSPSMSLSKPFLFAAAAGLTLFLAAAATQQEAPKSPVAKITGKTLIAANELKWEPLPGLAGSEEAKVVGDPAKEAHRAFFRFPVGMKSPQHSHTYGDRGVIVSGTLGLAVEGAPV